MKNVILLLSCLSLSGCAIGDMGSLNQLFGGGKSSLVVGPDGSIKFDGLEITGKFSHPNGTSGEFTAKTPANDSSKLLEMLIKAAVAGGT